VRALYAFCRVTDDIVDRGSSDSRTQLEQWRRRILAHHPPQDDLVAIAWADARLRYRVPVRYGEQLIDGVARDLTQSRYQTFEELAAYCYAVASTVGLMSMHVIGYAGAHAIPYAIKLGVALQLTNILRDVGEDWRAGRLYLPHEDLAQFGLQEEDIARGEVTDNWRAFMRYQIARNRLLYTEAAPGIALLDRDGRFAIGAAAGLYQGILQDIEAHDYDVFSRRAFVSKWGKLRRLPGIWWGCR
jgi:phytoene synthase